MSETSTTELQAVNTVLATIGETPVNSLVGTLPVDASIAKAKLYDTSRAVQAEGWHFNSEVDYPLPRNLDTTISVPANVLRIDVNEPSVDIVQRGPKLYDKVTHSFAFARDLKGDIILFLPFDDLPEAAKRYITIRTARLFQDAVLGSEEVHKYTEQEEQIARMTLLEAEGDTADRTIFDNYTVARALVR